MITLGNRKRGARGGEGHGFTFFVIGAAVVLIVVFLIGMQVGRVIEKGARQDNAAPALKVNLPARPDPGKEIGVFAEEASKVPFTPPLPSASEDARRTERNVTFQESLSEKDAKVVPLRQESVPGNAVRNKADSAGSRNGEILVQAGAFKDPKAAMRLKEKLEKAGYNSRISGEGTPGGTGVRKVLLGPYKNRQAARKVVRALKRDLKVQAFIATGGG